MFKISVSNTVDSSSSGFLFGIGAILILSLGLSLSFIQPGTIYTDGGIFTAVALKDLHEGGLYLNAWENKPPGILFLLETVFFIFGSSVYTIFILACSAQIIACLSIYILLYKYLKSLFTSLLLSMVAVYFCIYKNNVGDGLYSEIYGSLCILLALVFHVFYKEERKTILLYSAAFLCGSSFWFKEPFVFISIPVVLLLIGDIVRNKRIPFLFSFILPSLLISLLLILKGSFHAYLDSIRYNLTYINEEASVSPLVKINEVYSNLFQTSSGIFILFVYLIYKQFKSGKEINKAFLYLLIWIGSASVFLLSPYSFGHYYYPFFIFGFIAFAGIYSLYPNAASEIKWPLILLSVFTLYRIDAKQTPKLKFSIDSYNEDRITSFLKEQKGKTLFVDYVVRGDYYVKTGLIYPTYLPVALPVHFGESAQGLANRSRIWKELSTNSPDYLITTYTTSYFSWFLPETDFYAKHYTKIDSVEVKDENIIYLWKHTGK